MANFARPVNAGAQDVCRFVCELSFESVGVSRRVYSGKDLDLLLVFLNFRADYRSGKCLDKAQIAHSSSDMLSNAVFVGKSMTLRKCDKGQIEHMLSDAILGRKGITLEKFGMAQIVHSCVDMLSD